MLARSAIRPLVAFVGVALATGTPTRAAAPVAQVIEVRSRIEAHRPSVVIEASAPVSYAATQPDPLTVLVDLRHARADAAVTRLAPLGAPVADVAFESTTASDGADVARVRVRLAEPRVARVRSANREVIVDFDPATTDPVDVAGTAEAAVTTPTGVATALLSVVSETVDGRARIRLRGNGRLVPKSVEDAADPPPRVVIDLPGVVSKVPATLSVNKLGVSRVRVAVNSREPLVTRVVLDLTRKLAYDVTPVGDSELVVTVGEKLDAPVPAPAATPTPVEARETPAPVAAAPTAPAPMPAAPAPAAPAPTAAPSSPSGLVANIAPEPVTPAAPQAAVSTKRSAAPDTRVAQSARPAVASTPAKPAIKASSPDGAREFTGHPVSLDFQGVDLRAVLRTFADITGLNLVIDPAVNGTVDVALRDVPWDQALDIILRANQLGYSVDGTIVRIAPIRVLSDEEAQKRKLADEKALSGELQVYTRTLNYAKAPLIEPLLKNVLTSRGRTAVDLRTNMLIVQDLPDGLKRVEDLINTLDQPELQVEIEARVVLTTTAVAKDLGLRFGMLGAVAPELANTTNLAFPNSGALIAQSLAQPTGPSNAGLSLGSINGAFNLDIELAALERDRKLKTLLSPRIVTQNNTKAQITRGEEIPYTTQVVLPATVGGATVQTVPTVQFKTAALNLQVTPRITSANTVILEVDVDNGSRGAAVNEFNTNIAINTQRAQTTVLVADGATTVIGGIQVAEEGETETRTPGLWRLPWVGRLFRSTSKTNTQDEIVIFITPRIIRMPATAPTAPAVPPQGPQE